MRTWFRNGLATTALACTLGTMALMSPSGASPVGSASSWHVGYYTPSNRTLSMAQAGSEVGGVLATVNFTKLANTALLLSTQGSSGFLGNDLGKTVTAKFTIANAAGDFVYYGEPDACATAANVRLYFETSYAGGFAFSKYWWADDVTAFSYLGNGTFQLTALVSPTSAAWSDWNGQPSSGNLAAFNAAAGDVTGIGLSFGGGCGFENGVGTSDGSGTLTLTSFSVQ